ncbi:hypothetical protein [Flavobacterium sp.]|uniref:hypothetical protein n=1 Tax=Flavobacterium sp. TaxID=239 RepID=UPI0025DF3AA6|nr:hypothetical protein [Flavobacterium sp.]
MKRILSILALLLFITSCDDGKLTVDAIDFSSVAAQKCSDKDLIYKIKDSEMLFIEIPDATFTENQTAVGVPYEVALSSTVKVTYRKYASTVTSLNICGTVPDATPNLVEQWVATNGTVQITATAIKTPTATNNGTRISGYRYYIVFKNITFVKPSGTQQYDTFVFGNYTKPTIPLAFGFDNQVEKSSCTTDNRIFNFNGSEAFVLDVSDYPTLFANAVTTTPRTALIDANHKLSYILFNNAVTNSYFCTTLPPPTPTISQQWEAEAGVAATSGIIEVSTSTFGSSSFQHTIHFKKVSLQKGNSDFSLGDDYIFGSFVTP